MKTRNSVKAFLVAAALVIAFAPPARAQVTGVEVGTSLLNLTINWGGGNGSTTTAFGIPGGGGFNLLNPSLYASIFAGSHLAIEPQLALVVLHGGGNGNTAHFVNFGGQVDYFLNGSGANSPFVFGNAGLINMSGTGAPTPKWFGGGAGYRMLFGDRLAVRVDGRIMHFTDQFGNAFVVGISLGGVFGQR